jgi:phosphatidylserine decarboxylase
LRVPIHREGWLFIAIACAANVILFVLTPIAGWAFLPITIWVVAFFRDPERRTPLEPDPISARRTGKCCQWFTRLRRRSWKWDQPL